MQDVGLCVTYQGGGCSVPYPVDNSDSPSVVEQSQQALASVVFHLLFLDSDSVEYPMPYASCLTSCSVGGEYPVAQLILRSSAYSRVLSVMKLCLSIILGFCSPFYLGCFALHPGITCLGYVHYEIACLASQASYWAGALWDGLSGL